MTTEREEFDNRFCEVGYFNPTGTGLNTGIKTCCWKGDALKGTQPTPEELWSWHQQSVEKAVRKNSKDIRDGITYLINNSEGSPDWFNALRCARSVVDSAIDSLTPPQLDVKQEK